MFYCKLFSSLFLVALLFYGLEFYSVGKEKFFYSFRWFSSLSLENVFSSVLSVIFFREESRTSTRYWDLAWLAPMLFGALLNKRSLAESTLLAIAGAAAYLWVDLVVLKLLVYIF